ncbi:hypothetical protein MPTK1_1g27020 [Marchantia polymorpha subsp. ruderalis]|uniref:Uncharacterized protein n=2 Tax=Marchantia polymorpha TaxID=3197 RepID=A0AAF6AUQ7_MARPO|nr:hypothetical protein MARPO_0002s0176 [Marchantia polymorpha]BBN00178.1 hypothetical protein Mp_1g27020 [Marchantia polymorpha subsp. ruderalis]|eukprot:PTQ49706.1 hypothetical protein MARPO_0002s0176 [Marchantia polymorpha]
MMAERAVPKWAIEKRLESRYSSRLHANQTLSRNIQVSEHKGTYAVHRDDGAVQKSVKKWERNAQKGNPSSRPPRLTHRPNVQPSFQIEHQHH